MFRSTLEKIKSSISQATNAGFFHIFFSSVIAQFVSFCGSIFVVRIISKSNFGIYSYADNILTIFLLFNGMGMYTALLQFASETNEIEEKNSIFKFTLFIGTVFNLLIGAIILIFSAYVPLPIEGSASILSYFSFLPLLLFPFYSVTMYLRSRKLNKAYAYFQSGYSILNISFILLGAIFFGITGIITGRYISTALFSAFGLIYLAKFKALQSGPLEKSRKWEITKYAVAVLMINAMSQLLYLIDTNMVGNLIQDAKVLASYKTATTIPFALNFIPLSVVTFVYPYVAERKTDYRWIRQFTKKLVLFLGGLNLIITVVGVIFAQTIVTLFFGDQYSDAVPIFRLLMVGYFIAGTFRVPFGNVLAMMRKVKIAFYISLITCIVNIASDFWLIPQLHSMGAAYTNIIVYVLSSVLSGYFLLRELARKKEGKGF